MIVVVHLNNAILTIYVIDFLSTCITTFCLKERLSTRSKTHWVQENLLPNKHAQEQDDKSGKFTWA